MPLPKTFLVQMRYNYHRIVEGIYLKYNVILLGLTCADRSSIIFNPSRRDLDVFKHMKAMFEKFNIALVIAEDQHIANDINKQLSAPDSTVGASILRELSLAEEEFPCKREPEEGRVRSGTTGSMFPSPMLGSPVPMPMMKEEDEDDEDGDSGSGPSGHACGSDFNGSHSEGGNGLSSVVRNMGTMFSGKANPRSSTAGSPKSASAAVLMSGRSRSNSNAQAVSRADGFADDVDSDALSSDANGYTDDSDDVSGSDDDSDSSNENRKKRYIGFRKKGITDREKKGETESDTGKSEANEVQKGEINNISNVNGAKNVSKQISVDTRPHSAGEIDNKTVDSSNRNTVSSSMSALSPSRTRSGLLPASASNANSSNSNIPSPAAVAEKHRQNNSKKSNLRMKSKVKLSKRHIPTLTSSPIKLKSGLGSYQIQIGGPDANAALEMCEKGKNSRRKRPISSKKRGFVSTKSDFHTNRLEDREGFEADCDCNSEMNDKSDIDSERLLDRQEAGKEVENPPANPQSSIGSSSASGTDVTSKEEHNTANANSTKVGLSASPNSDAQSPSQSASGSDSDSDSDTNSDSSSEHQGEEFIEEDEEEDEVDSSSDEEVVDDSHLPLKLRRLPWELKVGKTSRELRNAFKISNHVVLFGCDENLPMFVSELRREAVTEDSYHPILVVAENPPIKWESIKQRFNDIYYIRGDLSNLDVFHTVNIEAAYSFVLMGVRNHRTKKVSAGTGGDTSGDSGGNVATSHKVDTEELDEESVDAVTLFTYLKLEQYIPLEVFCSVELTCTTNMAVMNATIMRKARSRMISFFLGNCGRARNSSQGRVSLSYGGGNGNNHGNNIDGNFNAERRSSQLEMGKASGSQSQPDQHDNSATGLKERLFNWFQIGGDSKIIPTTPLGAVSNVNKENTGEKDKADEPNVRGNTTPKAPLGPAPTGTPVGGALNNARRKSAFNSLPTLAGPSTDPMNVSPKSFIPPPPMVMPKRTIHINGEVGGISAPSSISKVRSQNDLLMDPNFNAAAQAAEKLHDSSMGLNLRGRNDSDADSDINRRVRKILCQHVVSFTSISVIITLIYSV